MKTENDFRRYVEFKIGQHARVMKRATQFRRDGKIQAEYLAQAAMIRGVLAKDLRIYG